MKPTPHDQLAKGADAMRIMDFCMFTTTTVDGSFRSRPMSNNGEVEFDGDVCFSTAADSREVAEIGQRHDGHLSYANPETWRFVSKAGVAALLTDVAKKEERWGKDLERWFPNGPTDDNVLLF